MQVEVQEVTVSETEPVTLAEAKAFIRVNFSNEDDITEDHISAARELIESYTDRSLVEKTLKARFYDFQDWDFEEASRYRLGRLTLELPNGKHGAISSVVSVDGDGTETAVDYDTYGLEFKEIVISRQFKPSNYMHEEYHVTYAAGSGTIEKGIKVAIMRLVGEMNESRQMSVFDMSVEELPLSLRNSLKPYRRTFI